MQAEVCFQLRTEKGIALVLTLAILVIATILVVGFATSMRTERQASASMANSENASLIAQSAIDHSISILDKNIPQPVPSGGSIASSTNWMINPGLLTLIPATGPSVQIPLSSNSSAGYAATDQDADLNVPLISGAGYTMLPTSDPMRVAWVPVLKNPSAGASSANPIIGRYAFWIDDENNKINLNTAYGKPFPNPLPMPAALPAGNTNGRYTRGNPPFTILGTVYTLGHPSSVDLGVLSGLNAGSLRTAASTHPLNSLEEVKQYVVSPSTPQAFYEANKFVLTQFNRDPEFNAFGKSRIFFADSMFYPYDYTNKTTANPYWDTGYAYRSEPTTTGVVADPTEPLIMHSYLMNDWNSQGYDGNGATPTSDSPATNPAAGAVARIAAYLNSSWPGYAQSFVSKYGIREAEQIAWNIYGLSAASTTLNTSSTQGAWANTTHRKTYGTGTPPKNMRWSSFLWDGPLASGARILPQTRSPMITKVGIGIALTQKDGNSPTRRWILDPSDPTDTRTIENTTQYAVAFEIAVELSLPAGYQGFRSTSGTTGQAWNLTNDRVFATHVEAEINGTKVVLASTTNNSALVYDADGSSSKMFVNSGQTGVLDPNSDTAGPGDGDRKVSVNSTPDLVTGDRAETGTSFTPGASWGKAKVWDANVFPIATISNIRVRLVATTSSGSGASADRIPYQISPIRDIDQAKGFEPGDSTTGAIVFPDPITIDSNIGYTSNGGPAVWACMETTDPRVNQLATDWQKSPQYNTFGGQSVLTTRTLPPYPASSADGDESKLAFPDSSQFTVSGIFPTHRGGRPHDTDKRLNSVGWLSCVSTGMQSGKPWRTLKFQPAGGGPPPDWLLMDLFAVPFNEATLPVNPGNPLNHLNQYPTGPIPLTYMNSTAGKVNINAKLFPDKTTNPYFEPPDRILPLRALFENMYRGTTQITASAAPAYNATNMAQAILDYQVANGPFTYAGQLCEVPGIADIGSNEWEKEAIIRNLGSLITIRSNAFSIWGVAQTVKKNPVNSNPLKWGVFETKASGAVANDVVLGEKRFHAIVERYVWPGMDGIAGNGATSGGNYSQLGGNEWLASPTNVTDGADISAPTFGQSYNPQVAHMKYRVRFIEYLDD